MNQGKFYTKWLVLIKKGIRIQDSEKKEIELKIKNNC